MQHIIQLLPDAIANQIAAGEVVQRPASVVKELLENAVDAGASKINVHLKDAGKTLIKITDDGCGMSAIDARMSFERHATSKIRDQKDLFRIRTLGFRGEALASIAAIAQVRMRTRLHDEELGTVLEIEGSEIKKQEACVTPPGTTIEVKNLFYNVRPRRNFLKTNPVETRHIINEFIRIAISNPGLNLRLEHNNTEIYALTESDLKSRLAAILGKELEEKLIELDEFAGYVRISGFIGDPSLARSKRGEQFFFVNGRFIKSSFLHSAVARVYQEFIPKDTHPMYCIFLETEPEHVDINIHPTKQEVKFDDESTIYTLLQSVVKQGLTEAHSAPDIELNSDLERAIYSSNSTSHFEPRAINTPTRTSEKTHNNNNHAPNHWESLYKAPSTTFQETEPEPTEKQVTLFQQGNKAQRTGEPELMVQFQNNYILTQQGSKLYIIHQQLAHQRILYERFLNAQKSGKIASQQLLFPQTMEFPVQDYMAIQEVEGTLVHMGFDVKDFGSNTIIVYGTPPEIPTSRIRSIFDQILADVREVGSQNLANRMPESIAKAISLRSAVTSGQKLSMLEMKNIVQSLFQCEVPGFAPNGNPTYKVIPAVELEEYFG